MVPKTVLAWVVIWAPEDVSVPLPLPPCVWISRVPLAVTVTVALQPVKVKDSTLALTVSLAPPVFEVLAEMAEPVHSTLAAPWKTVAPSASALIVDPVVTIPEEVTSSVPEAAVGERAARAIKRAARPKRLKNFIAPSSALTGEGRSLEFY
ncbi:MAG TPA: hypothetical protein VFT79_04160 [Solirubrobacterales bacterium]|nr:hypothetical protein [Solirubrobacterales bacterium]